MAEFNILQYTDAHGRFLSKLPQDHSIKAKGLDRLSSYIKNLKKKKTEYFLIDNGDAIQGQPLVDLWEEPANWKESLNHPLNLLHQALGVDVFVAGNHEFDFGIDQLKNIKAHSSLPWLSANIIETQSSLFQPFHIKEVQGVKIGVLGLITEFVPKWEPPRNIKGLVFGNVLESAKHWVPILRDQCDILIISYHGGFAEDPNTGKRLCSNILENQGIELWETFPEVDILFTGHQHRKFLFQSPDKAIALQPAAHGRFWAEIQVQTGSKIHLIPKIISASTHAPDPWITDLLSGNMECNQGILSEILGTADPSFQVADPMTQVWTKKHPLIQWVNELMMEHTNTDIAASSFLDYELEGLPETVTMQDILTTYFFHDAICVLEINGEILKAALEQIATFLVLPAGKQGIKNLETNPEWTGTRPRSYNYDFFEGIDYELDIRKDFGQRVTKLQYHGANIENSQKLKVALTTYRAGGGFFKMYGPHLVIEEFPTQITELMAANLKKVGHLKLEINQNFSIKA
ncbi:MAG: bifunctional UDP-sugar hydrolase/5'-nucleotidase [SAR324 cluster bacterium]|nr:bifunctional UDP-sugar hydrolase/5'-nucleotidase [SAR324 cluster bacterium]